MSKAVRSYDAQAAELFADISAVPEYFVRDSASWAADAQETLVFARQLETIKRRMYEVKYPELKNRKFVPEGNEAGPTTEYLTYRIWQDYVMAKVVSGYSTDIPMVTSSGSEVSVKPFSVADGYMYTVDELRSAQAANVPLIDRMARAVRMGIELAREEHVAFGTPEFGGGGLLNHPNVQLVSLPNGAWASATGEEILEDMNFLVTNMLTTTNEIFAGDTLVLTVAAHRLIATKILNTAAGERTVLEAFKAQNPGISVETWQKLATANSAGNGPRILFYKKDPEVLEFEVAIPFEQMPVEVRAMTYSVVCRAKWFGLQVQYPNAISYADNAAI